MLFVRYKPARSTGPLWTRLRWPQNRLAAGIYLTSMGLPFWQAGEEFARTKKGQGNSYRSSPALNRLDWKRAQQFHSLVDYYRGLIGLRAAFPRLGTLDKASPAAIEFFPLEQPLVGWRLPAQWGDGAAWSALCVYYNPTETAQVVTPARRELEAAERRHLIEPVAGQQPHLHRPDRPPAPERHRVRAGIKIRSAVA